MSPKEKDILDSSINRKYIISGVTKLIGVLFTITSFISGLYFRELISKIDKVYDNQQTILLQLQSDEGNIKELQNENIKQKDLNEDFTNRIYDLELAVQSLDIRFGLKGNTNNKNNGSRKFFQ